jgi:putative two-component system response regulator
MNMPGESGLDLIEGLVAEDADIATIMVTGEDDTDLANHALEIGAYGYVIKPFEANEILISVSNALRRRSLEIENRLHREKLEAMVRERTSELWTAVQELEQARSDLQASQTETVSRLSIAAEYRDDETARHIQRMSRYCALLAQKAGMDEQQAELFRVASIMHDVGKIGIPDNILLKPGKLTPEEYEIMKRHAEIGHRILSGSKWPLLEMAAEIAITHHEKCDGTGYPNGLTKDEIPLEGRIAAVADVFDAISTDRVYRKAFTLGQSVEILKEGRGSHFDPELLDLFLDALDEVLVIKDANE